jgi:uncharacterized protein
MNSISSRQIVDGNILIEKDVPIPLADGHLLFCNVFRPSDGRGRVPPILAFTPYGKDSDVAIDFKRYWDFVLRDHPEVVQGDSDGRYLTWEVPDPQRRLRGRRHRRPWYGKIARLLRNDVATADARFFRRD